MKYTNTIFLPKKICPICFYQYKTKEEACSISCLRKVDPLTLSQNHKTFTAQDRSLMQGLAKGGFWQAAEKPPKPSVRVAIPCVVCGFQTIERGAICSIACRRNSRRKLIRPREDDDEFPEEKMPESIRIAE